MVMVDSNTINNVCDIDLLMKLVGFYQLDSCDIILKTNQTLFTSIQTYTE